MTENEIDAAGIQCWESLELNYGCAACLTMSMLGEKLIPCACEADLTGVVSMYALMLASGTPSALLDWNNNFGDDRDMCVCTHCSNYPPRLLPERYRNRFAGRAGHCPGTGRHLWCSQG